MSRWLLASICLIITAWPSFAGTGFVITNVTTSLQDTDYKLNVHVEYIFNDTVLEALDNGVPLTIAMQIQVRRKGAWFWESSLVDLTKRSLIRYYPLTEFYKVTHLLNGLPNGSSHSFVTRAAAINTLGEIENLPLLKHNQIKPGEKYLIHIKVSLDIESLPLPLRPTAHLSSSWNLSSGWTQWPLEY